ncbi:MAG TPA: signal peptidase I [Acidimicrobiales bacterium]|nr:signal peptidase I [Acidimicrobiales bacterium]
MPATDATPPHAEPARRSHRGLVEWAVIIVVAVVVTFLVRQFVVEAYYIPSGSMEPTLMIGDRVLVDKLSYDLHSVHRGDIVVFARPPTEHDLQVDDLIKRVVGLPGDTISSGPGGEVLIDGKPLAQPWLTPHDRASPGPAIQPQTLGRGQYYMLGDNRDNSEDSRYIGPISGNLIVGRAVARVWPLGHFHIF